MDTHRNSVWKVPPLMARSATNGLTMAPIIQEELPPVPTPEQVVEQPITTIWTTAKRKPS